MNESDADYRVQVRGRLEPSEAALRDVLDAALIREECARARLIRMRGVRYTQWTRRLLVALGLFWAGGVGVTFLLVAQVPARALVVFGQAVAGQRAAFVIAAIAVALLTLLVFSISAMVIAQSGRATNEMWHANTMETKQAATAYARVASKYH